MGTDTLLACAKGGTGAKVAIRTIKIIKEMLNLIASALVKGTLHWKPSRVPVRTSSNFRYLMRGLRNRTFAEIIA
jgi:hypothetical protein